MAGSETRVGPVAEARLRRIWDEHHRSVFAYCRRRASPEAAGEIASEVFVVAWRKLDDVPNGAEARYWLLGVAAKVLANHRRRAARDRALRQRVAPRAATVEPGPEIVLVRRSEDEEVIAAARRLGHRDREILTLAAWEELPHKAIAEILGITPASVAQRLARAKRRLAKEYARGTHGRTGRKAGES